MRIMSIVMVFSQLFSYEQIFHIKAWGVGQCSGCTPKVLGRNPGKRTQWKLPYIYIYPRPVVLSSSVRPSCPSPLSLLSLLPLPGPGFAPPVRQRLPAASVAVALGGGGGPLQLCAAEGAGGGPCPSLPPSSLRALARASPDRFWSNGVRSKRIMVRVAEHMINIRSWRVCQFLLWGTHELDCCFGVELDRP